jgi:isopenicillin N synthase-like dioxygenase
MEMKGKTYKGYIYVSQEAIKTQQDFKFWIELSLDYNKRAKSSKKKKKS